MTKKNKALQRFVPKAALICAMFLLAVVACGGQSEVQEYFDQISALNEYNERFERYNELVDRESQIDPRSVTRAEVLDLVNEIFEAVTSAYEAARVARDQMRSVLPPEQCEAGHLSMLEILLLEEEMLGISRQYYRLGLDGTIRTDLLDRANALARESELAKQGALRDALDCE